MKPFLWAAFLVWAGPARADQLVLAAKPPRFSPVLVDNTIFVSLLNDSTRQGLQFDMTYDPAFGHPVDVRPLGRLGASVRVYSAISSPGILHVIAYDSSATRGAIDVGADSVIAITFAIRDTVPDSTMVIGVGGAISATDSLVSVPIAAQSIGVQLDQVTGTLLQVLDAKWLEQGRVRIEWEVSRADLGTRLYRDSPDSTGRVLLTPSPVVGPGLHFVEDTVPQLDSTHDWVYELFAVNAAGELSLGSVSINGGGLAPLRFALGQSRPNPFATSTTIDFDVPVRAQVRLAIYDVAGRLVQVLKHGDLLPGRYSAIWNGQDVEGRLVRSGIYFYAMTSDQFRGVRKATLLR